MEAPKLGFYLFIFVYENSQQAKGTRSTEHFIRKGGLSVTLEDNREKSLVFGITPVHLFAQIIQNWYQANFTKKHIFTHTLESI